MALHQNQYTAIDLFSGSGAVTGGLKNAGFKVVAAIDFDGQAAETYRLNHPDVSLFEEDILKIDPIKMRATISIDDRVDLLVVCAPCQPFSNQNRKKSTDDHRRSLVLESLKFVDAFQPRILIFENVPGIAKANIFNQLKTSLKAKGYFTSDPTKINAENLGVPQRRIRSVTVAIRKDLYSSDFFSLIPEIPKKSVRDVIGHLPSLKSGEKDSGDPLHFARNHTPIALERLSFIPRNGGSRFALPSRLELECHKGSRAFPDVYGRMAWDLPAPTLTTGCTDITRGRFAHPKDDRAISLREAALLQTFPSDYKFAGNPGQIARQIGNAVPLKMAEELGRAAIGLLKSN